MRKYDWHPQKQPYDVQIENTEQLGRTSYSLLSKLKATNIIDYIQRHYDTIEDKAENYPPEINILETFLPN